MGISHYMIENYPLAIESLEKSTECETDKDILSVIYGTLGDSYRKIKDYQNAILSAEKMIYISEDEVVLSGAYEISMYVYFEQGNYNKTVQNFEKTIHHYLNYLSATEDDVMKGKVDDDFLGELYIKFAAYYNDHDNVYEAEQQLIKSALCGYEYAIDSCETLGLKY